MKWFIFLSLYFSFFTKAYAYPTYIRLNYSSCVACHQSVEGGGPLTAYGKGIAFAESYKKGEYKNPAPTFMEHSVEARLMALDRLYDYAGKKTRIFPMQLDYSNVVNWQKNLKQTITFSVAPNTARQKGVDGNTAQKSTWTDRVYLENFKLDYSIDKNNHLVFGGSILPLGVRLVDHTAFVRERNRLGVTDVPIQFQYINLSKQLQQTYLAFAPNPNDGANNREMGIALKEEYFLKSNVAIGTQGLKAIGKSIDRDLIGLFGRTGIEKWAVLTEFDFTHRSLVNSSISFDQWASFIESSYFFTEYLKSSFSFQVLRVMNPFKEKAELYTFNNEFKYSANTSFILEYRQKNTDLLLEKMVFGQVFLNWW